MTYECPLGCAATTTDPTSMLEHASTEHGTQLSVAALPAPTFISQFEARHGVRPTAIIGCRSCARDTHRIDGQWRHCDDETLACLNPETMKPYQPQGETAMSTATTVKPTKPGREVERKWFFTLDADEKAAARESVALLVTNEGLSVSQAWTVVYDAAHAEPEQAEPAAAKPNTRVERLAAAKAERAAVKEAEAAGEPKPATPVLDEMATEKLGGRPKASPAVKASTKKAVARATGDALEWFIDGKQVNAPHDRLSGVSRVTGRKGGERISTEALRALLVENGIADPDNSVWSFTLGNGVTISTAKGSK